MDADHPVGTGPVGIGKVATVHVHRDHLPLTRFAGDACERIRVILVAMGDNRVLRICDCRDRGMVRDQIRGSEACGAGEAADELRAGRADTPEVEIGEIGIQRSIRMHRQIAPLQGGFVDRLGDAGYGDAREGLRVGVLGRSDRQDGATRINPEVPCVLRQVRKQQKQRKVGCCRRGDQGGVRMSLGGGCQRCHAGGTQQLAGGPGGRIGHAGSFPRVSSTV